MGSKVPPKIASLKVRELSPLDLDRVDLDFLYRPVLRTARNFGDFVDHVVAFHHLAEDAVLFIQPRSGRYRDEELAAVGVRAGVGHRQKALFGMVEIGMKLIGEAISRSAAAGPFGIAALNHEIGN